MIFTISNVLTILRILLVPILTITFCIPSSYYRVLGSVIFLFASCTDWLDGFLARYFHQTTKLGAFLDQIADKLIVAAALTLVVSFYPYSCIIIPATIIICREIIVSALRDWVHEIGQGIVIKVSLIGKLKTTFQMIAIFLLLLNPNNCYDIWVIFGFVLLYTSVILTLYSMWIYLCLSYKLFKKQSYNE